MHRIEILYSISVFKAEYGFLTFSMTGNVLFHVIRPMVQKNVASARKFAILKRIKGELDSMNPEWTQLTKLG